MPWAVLRPCAVHQPVFCTALRSAGVSPSACRAVPVVQSPCGAPVLSQCTRWPVHLMRLRAIRDAFTLTRPHLLATSPRGRVAYRVLCSRPVRCRHEAVVSCHLSPHQSAGGASSRRVVVVAGADAAPRRCLRPPRPRRLGPVHSASVRQFTSPWAARSRSWGRLRPCSFRAGWPLMRVSLKPRRSRGPQDAGLSAGRVERCLGGRTRRFRPCCSCWPGCRRRSSVAACPSPTAPGLLVEETFHWPMSGR